MGERKSGEGTSAATATPRPKEVVDVESIPETAAPVERGSKRRENAEIGPEKSRKRIRTISLAKKKREECVTDIHVLPDGEPGLCTLPAGSTLVEPEAEKKLEELELEAKTVLPQV